jgi:ubiquinone/menaquinone biosynthesis C-methylase UbiE
MDNDVKKLRGFKGKWPFHLALLGDATRIGLKDKSVDYAICIALSHHLPEPDLFILFSELARVVRKKLIFLDAVKDNGSKISHWLWKFDRGSYPRPSYILFSAIETWFKAEHIEHYLIQHEYVLYIGIPREK